MNPRPVSNNLIDWHSFEVWHQWCKATDHTCNAIIDSQIIVKEILEKICSTGRASLAIRDGKYTIIQDVEKTVPIQLFTPRNSWGFAGAKYFSEKPHALKISFIDAERGWQPNERIVYDDGYNEDGSEGKLLADKFQKLTFWGVSNANQIWKDGRYQIAVNRLRPETFTLNCDIENLVCTRGDLVRVAHDVPLLGLYSGRIKQLISDINNNIISIVIDELIRMVDGMSYGIRIRKSNGVNIVKPVNTIHGETNTITFQTPISSIENVLVGDLFSFGYNSLETVEMIITCIEARKDLTATMYLIPAAPGVHLADHGNIPDYNSAVSLPGDFNNQLRIDQINDYASIPKTVENSAKQTALIENIVNQLQTIPTASELLTGTTKGGWTETPEKPVIEYAVNIGSSAMLRIVKQFNLSNFHHYAIQISKDQSNWFSLFLAGTGADWKDAPGEYTPWPVELFVHTRLPLAGTLADPQPETYYYRVAVVTKKLDISAWSDVAAVTVSPIQNGDIAADFLAANSALIGKLVALFFQANYAIIGFQGTGTYNSPKEGDRWIALRGDEIIIGEEETGGTPSTINAIKLGGKVSGQFSGQIGCKGLYHPESPPDNIEYFPNYNYLLYNFEGNYANHNGIDDWTLKLNQAIDTTDFKFGTGSFFATENNMSYLRKNSRCNVGASQTICCWVKCTQFDAGNATLFYFYRATNYFAVYLYPFMVEVEIMKGGRQQKLSTFINLADAIWHFIAFAYDANTDTVYLVIDNTSYNLTLGGSWTASDYFAMSVYAANHYMYSANNYITYKLDELCIGYNTFIPPAILIQHFNHKHPWNTKRSAADLNLSCGKYGKIFFDTKQSVPALGLAHPTGLKFIRTVAVTTTAVQVDLFSYIPPRTTGVDLVVGSYPSTANFQGYVSPDNNYMDDTFLNYTLNMYKSDHIFTRVNSNRAFFIMAAHGAANVDIYLVRYYY